MRLITISGPPSSGKTSVIIHLVQSYEQLGIKVGVIKMDCLMTEDDEIYKAKNIPVLVGLSGNLCPDHYFASNFDFCIEWGEKNNLELLIIESAGLCNRCSPHIKNIKAVCVIDNLMGVKTPRKIGPMLKMADVVVVTKGDIVSQAEREVFAFYIRQSNPNAYILTVNGITGQGCSAMAEILEGGSIVTDDLKLRFQMPAALCSYCLGETRIGEAFNMGNVRRIDE